MFSISTESFLLRKKLYVDILYKFIEKKYTFRLINHFSVATDTGLPPVDQCSLFFITHYDPNLPVAGYTYNPLSHNAYRHYSFAPCSHSLFHIS